MDYQEKVLRVATALAAAKITRGHALNSRAETEALVKEAMWLVEVVQKLTEPEE